MAFFPGDEAVVVVFWACRVAVNRMGSAFRNGPDHRFRRRKIHIGYPHRQSVLDAEAFLQPVPFVAVSAEAVSLFVEIVDHRKALSFCYEGFRNLCAVISRYQEQLLSLARSPRGKAAAAVFPASGKEIGPQCEAPQGHVEIHCIPRAGQAEPHVQHKHPR